MTTTGQRSSTKKPFIVSYEQSYVLLALLIVAILGPLVDGSMGFEPFSIPGVAILPGAALGTIYFLWGAVDTISWLRKRPEEFFQFVRPKKGSWLSWEFLMKQENVTWFYGWGSIFYFFLGILCLMLTLIALLSHFIS